MAEPRKYLHRKEDFIVTNYMQKEYSVSGLTDNEFAAKAAEELGIPHLKGSHIQGIRVAFEIPSNHGKVSAKGMRIQNEAIETRFRALERRLAVAEQRLDVYLSTGKKVEA